MSRWTGSSSQNISILPDVMGAAYWRSRGCHLMIYGCEECGEACCCCFGRPTGKNRELVPRQMPRISADSWNPEESECFCLGRVRPVSSVSVVVREIDSCETDVRASYGTMMTMFALRRNFGTWNWSRFVSWRNLEGNGRYRGLLGANGTTSC